jgi:hypothetical protein
MEYRFIFRQGGGRHCPADLIVSETILLEDIWESQDFHQYCFDNDIEMGSLSNAEMISEYAQCVSEVRGGFCTIDALE